MIMASSIRHDVKFHDYAASHTGDIRVAVYSGYAGISAGEAPMLSIAGTRLLFNAAIELTLC